MAPEVFDSPTRRISGLEARMAVTEAKMADVTSRLERMGNILQRLDGRLWTILLMAAGSLFTAIISSVLSFTMKK